MNWQRNEPKTARPFFELAEIQGILKSSTLVIGDSERSIDDDHLSLEPEEFEQPFSIHFDFDRPRLVELLGDLSRRTRLTISLRDPMLKRRLVVHDHSLSNEIPGVFEIPPDSVLKFSHGRELQIRIFLAIKDNLPTDKPGFPAHAGQWLDKRVFTIKTPQALSSFRIAPMTPQEAKMYTGYSGALTHVDYNTGTMLEEANPDNPVAECYVAEVVYRAAEKDSAGSISKILMMEVIAGILWEARDDIRGVEESEDDTPLASVLEHLSSEKSFEFAELKKVIEDPLLLRAAIQDRLDIANRLGDLK